MKSSGALNFDALRDGLAADPDLRAELESALRVNVRRVNPTDRGNRFITGGANEWILAAAAWNLGILAVPEGHAANGYDLVDLAAEARALWSVKSSNAAKGGDFRISNGLGGGGAGLADPTLFLSPRLPGIVFVDPTLHPDIKAQEKTTKDAVTLGMKVLLAHARLRPECVAPLRMPVNDGMGRENPFLQYSKTILTPEQFPMLSRMFTETAPDRTDVAETLTRLALLRDQAKISPEQFAAAVAKVLA